MTMMNTKTLNGLDSFSSLIPDFKFVCLIDCVSYAHTCVTLKKKARVFDLPVVVWKKEVYFSKADWNMDSLDCVEIAVDASFVR